MYDERFHPGLFLAHLLIERNDSRSEFVQAVEIEDSVLEEILDGLRDINRCQSQRISDVFPGWDRDMWWHFQQAHDDWKSRNSRETIQRQYKEQRAMPRTPSHPLRDILCLLAHVRAPE
jgi:plasmid maintenance system antidote protein VapI